jgi:peptidoglycan/xylan/chitin deacetylase (PgdA/CDA1 family)
MALKVMLKGAGRLSLGWGCSLSGVPLLVPYYHMVSDAPVPHVSPLYRFRTIAEFTADLECLARHFQPVTLNDIVDHLNGVRPLGRRCFHLTFDDGFREMYDVVAPILRRAGVPATFFVNTAFLDCGGIAHYNALSVLLDRLESLGSAISAASRQRLDAMLQPPAGNEDTSLRKLMLSLRHAQRPLVDALADVLDIDLDEYVRDRRPYLSSEQIGTLLQNGFTIGAHSHEHPRYTDLSLTEQIEQTRKSVEFIEQRFAVKPKAFAFPHSADGVGPAFFKAVFDESLLDVSFGTGGLVPPVHRRNIDRFSMEQSTVSASEILARQLMRAGYFRFTGRSKSGLSGSS